MRMSRELATIPYVRDGDQNHPGWVRDWVRTPRLLCL